MADQRNRGAGAAVASSLEVSSTSADQTLTVDTDKNTLNVYGGPPATETLTAMQIKEEDLSISRPVYPDPHPQHQQEIQPNDPNRPHYRQPQELPEITREMLEALGDRHMEKRRNAAHKIQNIVGEYIRKGKFERLRSVLEGITAQYASADDPQYRRGGALAVAAAVSGMDVQTATQHLDIISEAVITRFSDQDDSVRKDAVESLFNIVKFVGHRILPIFPIVFTSLTKLFADRSDAVVTAAQQLNERLISTFATNDYDKESFLKIFVATIKENMHTQHPRIQSLILSWIREMDKVKDIDLIEYLPQFADRVFAMLESPNQTVCTQAMETLSDFRKYLANLDVDQLEERISVASVVDLLVGQSSSPCNLTRLTSVEWMLTLIQLAGPKLLPWAATVLDFVFQLLSDPSDEVVRKAHECNGLMLELTNAHVPSQSYESPITKHDAEFEQDFRQLEKQQMTEANESSIENPAEKFTFSAVLAVINLALPSPDTYTRTEALNWFTALLQKAPGHVMEHFNELLMSLLHNLGDNADPNVLKSNIEVLARCAYYDWDYFHGFVLEKIVAMFARSRALLENRGVFIIRRLCKQLVPEHILIGISRILKNEEHPEFASIMVEMLNLILLTASELGEVRETLRGALGGKQGAAKSTMVDISTLQDQLHHRRATGIELFEALFVTWCHNSIATFSLCLLAEAYELASALVTRITSDQISVGLLMQIDKLVQLLESPVFISLRMHLLQTERNDHQYLLRSLYGLLMILPQSTAFEKLRSRLTSIPQSSDTRGQRVEQSSSKFDRFLNVYDAVKTRHSRFGEDADLPTFASELSNR